MSLRGTDLAATTHLDQFLAMCCDELERRARRASTNGDVLMAGAGEFRRALDGTRPLSHWATTIPATKYLPAITPSESTTADICVALQAAAPEVPWTATPRLDDGGVSAGLAPLNNVREFGALVCGLMLLAPEAAYPEHSHPPNEIYLPIAGHGQWRYGGAEDYVSLGPDALVYNHPNDRHGAVASDEPLLALYILWN